MGKYFDKYMAYYEALTPAEKFLEGEMLKFLKGLNEEKREFYCKDAMSTRDLLNEGPKRQEEGERTSSDECKIVSMADWWHSKKLIP